MTNSVSRAKDEKLRIELLQTIFKFKKLANSGLGMRPLDGKQDISLAEFMLLRAVDNNSADSPSNVSSNGYRAISLRHKRCGVADAALA